MPLASPEHADERKIVTVMFADLSGFTALTESMDPEAVLELMNACFERLVPVVERWGGTVDKFIGDEIMALFGAPVAHEDDPARALAAALQMRDALAEFSRERAVQLRMHVGINTGPVVAGWVGSRSRREYTVLGDTVNVAARLRDRAQPGEVVIGPETARQAAGRFRADPLPPLALKGRVDPVAVFRLVGAADLGEDAPPMLGRGRELAALRLRLEALGRGEPAPICVVGEPGVGKTRLLTALREEGRAAWLVARPDPATGAVAGGLARQALALWSADDCRDLPTLDRLLRAHLSAGRAERLLDPLAGALGIPGAAPVAPPVGDRALRALLEAVARRWPVAVLADEMHRAEGGARDTIAALLRAAGPVAVVLATRPGDLSWAGVARLELGPLAPADARQLLQRVAGSADLPRRTTTRLLAAAAGNPLFLLAATHAAVEAGHRGQVVEVPASLHSLFAARVDLLAPRLKQVLQAAAVLGTGFVPAVLARLLEEPEGAFSADLDLLVERGLFLRETSRLVFREAGVREAAYGALLGGRRRELHRAAAEALLVLNRDEDGAVADIARHLDAADDPRAAGYLVRAGERAVAAGDGASALAAFTAAARRMEAAPVDATTLAALRVRLGEVHLRAGRAVEAREAFAAARRGDPALAPRTLRREASTWMMQRQPAEAFARWAQAEAALPAEAARSSAEWMEWVEIQLDRIWVHYFRAEEAEIARLAAQTWPVLQRDGTGEQRSRFLRAKCLAAFRRDRYQVSAETLADARAAFAADRDAPLPAVRAEAHFMLGFTLLWQGTLGEARRHLRAATHEAERGGDVVLRARSVTYLAVTLRRMGRGALIAPVLHACREAALEADMPEYAATAAANEAWLLARAGRHEQARVAAEAALLGWSESYPGPRFPMRWLALGPLLRCHAAAGDAAALRRTAADLLHPGGLRLPAPLEEALQRLSRARVARLGPLDALAAGWGLT